TDDNFPASETALLWLGSGSRDTPGGPIAIITVVGFSFMTPKTGAAIACGTQVAITRCRNEPTSFIWTPPPSPTTRSKCGRLALERRDSARNLRHANEKSKKQGTFATASKNRTAALGCFLWRMTYHHRQPTRARGHKRMQAILLEKPGTFRQISIAEPDRPEPGDALVRVHRVGICGTDISGYLGKMPFFSYPRIPGHELGVEVLEVGPGVTNVKPGDCCSVEPYINCQKCFSCRRGLTNCCEKHQTLGVHCDGGLRPRFLVPARKLHVSSKLGFEQLALVETLAIGCHAIHRSAPRRGESC